MTYNNGLLVANQILATKPGWNLREFTTDEIETVAGRAAWSNPSSLTLHYIHLNGLDAQNRAFENLEIYPNYRRNNLYIKNPEEQLYLYYTDRNMLINRDGLRDLFSQLFSRHLSTAEMLQLRHKYAAEWEDKEPGVLKNED